MSIVTQLCEAALVGDNHTIMFIVRGEGSLSDLCERNISGQTPVHCAVSGGHVETVRMLVEDLSADINASDMFGTTALHISASNPSRDEPFFDELLRLGADASLRDNRGKTPMHRAAVNGNVSAIRAMVRNGADINQRCRFGDTAVLLMASYGSAEKVSELVLLGADPSVKRKDGSTAVHNASYGKSENIRFLVSQFGLDPNTPDKAGNTPLHIASFNGNSEAIETLVELGAIVDVVNNSGHTPLKSAVLNGQASAIFKLVSLGADPNHISNTGLWNEAPLHIAATKKQTDIIRLLVSLGANVSGRQKNPPNLTKDENDTPLHRAATHGNIDAMRTLIELGADVKSKGERGETPLHRAAAAGVPPEAIFTLWEHGADPDARNVFGETALHHASEGHSQLIDILAIGHNNQTVSKDFEMEQTESHDSLSENSHTERNRTSSIISSTTCVGATPLHYAAINGHINAARSLAILGASMSAVDGQHRSPLEYALSSKRCDDETTLALCQEVFEPFGFDFSSYCAVIPISLAIEHNKNETAIFLIQLKH